MTRFDTSLGLAELNLAVAELFEKFGRRRAFFAVLRHFLTPRSMPPDADSILSDHMRRDIGLPPRVPTPAERRWGAGL